jgi:hypothetical protein
MSSYYTWNFSCHNWKSGRATHSTNKKHGRKTDQVRELGEILKNGKGKLGDGKRQNLLLSRKNVN